MTQNIKEALNELKKELNFIYITEYQFDKHYCKKQYRADFCIPEYGILIEFEGIGSKKSRHTNKIGYSQDSKKYNKAMVLGFSTLRYTTFYQNKEQIKNDISIIIKRIKLTSKNNHKCCNCNDVLLINPLLWIKTPTGYRCLYCQYKIDKKIK